MEWGITLVASFVVLVLVGPFIVLIGGVLTMAVLGHFLPSSPTVARASFDCPFVKRRVTVQFLSGAGLGRPADALSCSVFTDARDIRCKKECLQLAETSWALPSVAPRYALIAGGVTY